MGCLFSRSSPTEPLDCVRVIHVNGFVEDYAAPVTVSDVVGKPSKHVLCSSAHLLSAGSPLLRPEDSLEPGRIYFLLPHSVFHSAESSPIDLASLVSRLTAAAKRAGPAGEPTAVSAAAEGKTAQEQAESQGKVMWKPVLETIRELSFRLSMTRDASLSFGSNNGRSGRMQLDTSLQMEPLEECGSPDFDFSKDASKTTVES